MKYKLTLLFKSGNQVKISCDEYKFTYNNVSGEFTSYNISGPEPMVSFVPSQLECYIVH